MTFICMKALAKTAEKWCPLLTPTDACHTSERGWQTLDDNNF